MIPSPSKSSDGSMPPIVCAYVIELIPINKTNKHTLIEERIRIFFLLV
jgi:hypothetical protein